MTEPEPGPPPKPAPPGPGTPSSPAPGGLVEIGSYRLIRPLGSGGMSSVFQGVHTETGHEVALKILPRSLARNATLLQRFLREAQSAESLEHPNIVAIYDRGVEAGRYYLVLEFIPGGDLHDRVRDRGPMPVSEAVPIIRGVAEALRYASQHRLIHRDIKPANVLLDADGRPRLADLGLALHVDDDEDERVTRDGTTVGTVDYMAPEQARDSRGTSVRSDIYSLGCTFYHLLAGKPPFIGGDVPEKLRKHAFEGPPDVRKVRPDVPEALGLLIQKMMAKKPEHRPPDYDALIADLDALPLAGGTSGPLFALLDDDDNDPGGPNPVPPGPTVAASSGPAYALIDDEDEPPPARPVAEDRKPAASPPRAKARPSTPSATPVVSMSELAGLDDSDQAERKPPKARRPATPARGVEPAPAPPGPRPADALIDDDDDSSSPLTTAPTRPRSALDETSLRDLIVRGFLVGLAIVLVGVGIRQVMSLIGPSGPELEASGVADSISADPGVGNGPEAGILPHDSSGAGSDLPAREVDPAPPSSRPNKSDIASSAEAPPSPSNTATAWVEPPDPGPPNPGPEPALSGTIESQLRPDWARNDPPVPGPTVVVRRFDVSPANADGLRSAFETDGGTTEIADTGPFYEADLAPGNRPRLIRAAGGVRPIVVLQPPTLPGNRSASCLWAIASTDVRFEGVDLVIPAGGLPNNVTALFEVRAGSLTLRDCTVTVLGGSVDRPFTVVRLAGAPNGPATPHARLERCLVRGLAVNTLELSGRGEAVVNRSILSSGSAPAVWVSRRSDPAGSIVFLRSAVLSETDAIRLVGSGPSPGPRIGSAGSTFARVVSVGASGAPFIAARDRKEAGAALPASSPSGPAGALDWLGDNNVFRGWTNWFESGAGAPDVVSHLRAARTIWPTSEARSGERPEALSATVGQPLTTPVLVAEALPELVASLALVPGPSAYLIEKTVGSFELCPVATSPDGSLTPDLDLTFDASDPEFAGDLGRFLASRVRPGPKIVRVVAQGQGAQASTPYRLPQGMRLSIQVVPATPPLEWVPTSDDEGPLIDARGSDLELVGVRLRNPSPKGPVDLVRVEDGRAALIGCRLTQGRADGAATALHLIARTTRPLPPPVGLPASAPGADLPSARLSNSSVIASGTAILAEYARGVLRLDHCVVAGAISAIELRPCPVRRSSFLADLVLDRCTLAAGRNAIEVGPWTGAPQGPDRPWLVSSRECVVLVPADATGRRGDPGVALRSHMDGVPRGALLWQGGSNVYNVARLVALDDQPAPSPGPRPDVTREWVDVWGPSHVQRVFGPGKPIPPPPGGTAPTAAPAQGLPLPPRLTADILIQAGTMLGPEFGARPQPPPAIAAIAPATSPNRTTAIAPTGAPPAPRAPLGKPASAATNRPF